MKNKKRFPLLAVVIAISFITSCTSSNKDNEQVIVVKESNIVRKSIGVNGMTCVGCEVTLEENISKIKGVVGVKASHTEKKVTIEFDSSKVNLENITKAVKESGYKPFSN